MKFPIKQLNATEKEVFADTLGLEPEDAELKQVSPHTTLGPNCWVDMNSRERVVLWNSTDQRRDMFLRYIWASQVELESLFGRVAIFRGLSEEDLELLLSEESP